MNQTSRHLLIILWPLYGVQQHLPQRFVEVQLQAAGHLLLKFTAAVLLRVSALWAGGLTSSSWMEAIGGLEQLLAAFSST